MSSQARPAARLAALTLTALVAAAPAMAAARPAGVLPPKRPASLGLDVDTTGSTGPVQLVACHQWPLESSWPTLIAAPVTPSSKRVPPNALSNLCTG